MVVVVYTFLGQLIDKSGPLIKNFAQLSNKSCRLPRVQIETAEVCESWPFVFEFDNRQQI